MVCSAITLGYWAATWSRFILWSKHWNPHKDEIRINGTGTSCRVNLPVTSMTVGILLFLFFFSHFFCELIVPVSEMGQGHKNCAFLPAHLQKVSSTFARITAGWCTVVTQICHPRFCQWVQLSVGCDYAPEVSADRAAVESLDPDIWPSHGGGQRSALALYCMGIWS